MQGKRTIRVGIRGGEGGGDLDGVQDGVCVKECKEREP